MKTIETKRLLLRKMVPGDAKAILEFLGNQEVNEFLPMFPIKTLEEAENYINNQHDKHNYAICFKADNKLIGYINVSDKDSHELGYALAHQYWNQGITSEACLGLIEALKKDNIPFITATHDVNNKNSGKIMENINMTYHYSYNECVQPKNQNVTFKMYQLNFDPNSEVYKGFTQQS